MMPLIGRIRTASRRPRSVRGQALLELAIALPLLLAIAGITVDFARVYQTRIALEDATRHAAEYVASFCPDNPQLAQGCQDGAETVARTIICTETQGMAGFTGSGSDCTAPAVTIVEFANPPSTTALGATAAHPMGSATVEATLPFRMAFNYPILTHNGAWTITVTESFSVLQGR